MTSSTTPPKALPSIIRTVATQLIQQAHGKIDAALEATVEAADSTQWIHDPELSRSLLASLGPDTQGSLLAIADQAGYRLSDFASVDDLCRLLASHHVEHCLRQEVARMAAA